MRGLEHANQMSRVYKVHRLICYYGIQKINEKKNLKKYNGLVFNSAQLFVVLVLTLFNAMVGEGGECA